MYTLNKEMFAGKQIGFKMLESDISAHEIPMTIYV